MGKGTVETTQHEKIDKKLAQLAKNVVEGKDIDTRQKF